MIVEKIGLPAFTARIFIVSISSYFYYGRWHFTDLFKQEYPDIFKDICDITLLFFAHDTFVCRLSPNGVLSGSLAYDHLRDL